jgi:hypothetical protein
MTYSQEKIDAYAALDKAIEQLRVAHGYTDDMLTGYVLLTSSVKFQEPCDDPACDDIDLDMSNGWFTKRGQDPTLSYGIVNEALRHYNSAQLRWAGDE